MKQTKITYNLKPLEDFQKGMTEQYRARVGILGSHAAREDTASGLNNAELGLIQMVGSVTKNIPPRDFLFMPIMSHAREIVKAMSGAPVKAAIAAGNIKKVYDLLGVKALEFVLMAFETRGFGQWAENKPSTIRRKGSDQPLIDTTQLKTAQISDVVNKSDIA